MKIKRKQSITTVGSITDQVSAHSDVRHLADMESDRTPTRVSLQYKIWIGHLDWNMSISQKITTVSAWAHINMETYQYQVII